MRLKKKKKRQYPLLASSVCTPQMACVCAVCVCVRPHARRMTVKCALCWHSHISVLHTHTHTFSVWGPWISGAKGGYHQKIHVYWFARHQGGAYRESELVYRLKSTVASYQSDPTLTVPWLISTVHVSLCSSAPPPPPPSLKLTRDYIGK